MSNKAVFLDRDGVINIDHSYVIRWKILILSRVFLTFAAMLKS